MVEVQCAITAGLPAFSIVGLPNKAVSEARDRVRAALGAGFEALDRFDAAQLEEVLRVCADASSLSAAGRVLFAASRTRKRSVNDADRLRKYLAKFELDFDAAKAIAYRG